jgi:hypothetical protein
MGCQFVFLFEIGFISVSFVYFLNLLNAYNELFFPQFISFKVGFLAILPVACIKRENAQEDPPGQGSQLRNGTFNFELLDGGGGYTAESKISKMF